jgi:hypothetical protein
VLSAVSQLWSTKRSYLLQSTLPTVYLRPPLVIIWDQLEIFILHGAPNFPSSLLLSGHFPFAFSHAVTRLALYSRSVANRSAVSLPEKCLTGMPFRLTVHQV